MGCLIDGDDDGDLQSSLDSPIPGCEAALSLRCVVLLEDLWSGA